MKKQTEQNKTYQQSYYEKNKERELERVRKYKEAHRAKVNAQAKEYRERNKDRIKEYRDNPVNKEKAKAYQKAYYEKKRLEKRNSADEREKLVHKMKLLIKEIEYAIDSLVILEEKDLGVLTEKEHKKVCSDRDFYSLLYVDILNRLNTDKEEIVQESPVLLNTSLLSERDDDEEDDSDGFVRKQNRNELEM